MPLVGPVLGGLILGQFAAQGFTGTQSTQLAFALGNGIVTNILATNIYQGTAVGTGTGAGVGTGIVQGVVGPVVGANIFAMMSAQGFTGTKSFNTALAIGNAFATHILQGIVQSTSAPVAIGTGFGKILGVVGPAMGATILGFMTAQGLTGTKTINMANAVGNGIANSLNIAVVTTTIVGVGYPPVPAGGVDIGKLI